MLGVAQQVGIPTGTGVDNSNDGESLRLDELSWSHQQSAAFFMRKKKESKWLVPSRQLISETTLDITNDYVTNRISQFASRLQRLATKSLLLQQENETLASALLEPFISAFGIETDIAMFYGFIAVRIKSFPNNVYMNSEGQVFIDHDSSFKKDQKNQYRKLSKKEKNDLSYNIVQNYIDAYMQSPLSKAFVPPLEDNRFEIWQKY